MFCTRQRIARWFLVGLCIVALQACNRAGLRIPGASGAMPATPTGIVAQSPIASTIDVVLPVDHRAGWIGKPIANTKWTGCTTDAMYAQSAAEFVQERVKREIAATGLTGAGAGPNLQLRSELRAYCAQVVGFVVARVAGIVAIEFVLERDGQPIWRKTIERVVTDDQPEFIGSQVNTVEQAMREAIASSMILVLKDLVTELRQVKT